MSEAPTGLATFAAAIAGWPLVIGAALIAVGVLIYNFRDGIGKVIVAISKAIGGAVEAISKTIYDGIGAVWGWVSTSIGNVAGALGRPFEAAAGAIKNVLRGVLQFGANIINGFLGAVNQAISAVNNVASRVNLPQLPTFSPVQVPSFEGGGHTGNAPRIGGLDGRGGFPAILHPQETIIDHARNGRQSSTPAAINIPITTGQVIQMPNGTDYVSMSDFQAGMQAVAEGMMAQLFTPAGRLALRGV